MRMRVDAHHHLWDLAARPQPWMDGPWADPVRRTFGLAHLLPHLDAHGIDASVLVQSSSSYDETRDLLALARESRGRIAGVVGWADLTDPGPVTALAGLGRGLGRGLVGIRHQVQDEPDPAWLTRPEVLRGLAAVRDAGLVYDLLVTPRELPAAITAARALPGLTFVLDHAGKPPIASGGLTAWAEQVADLARLPNVVCKLSGLVTEADWATWRPQDVLPAARHVLDVFGPDRLMFGSDWPVCLLAAPYDAVHALAAGATEHLAPAERAAVFGGTAVRTYSLG